MKTTGYLFGDDRQEGLPFTLFIDGLEPDEEGEDEGVQTLEVRFHDLWEAAETLSTLGEELGKFPLELGEPDHYASVLEEEDGG